jgi:hypothetical protein
MKKQVSIKLIAKDNGWKVWREAMSNAADHKAWFFIQERTSSGLTGQA